MTDGPRILDEAAAREYLGGRNPRLIMPPVRIGGRNCWDRVALDQKLDELFGVRHVKDAASESSLERWRRNKRLSAEQAGAEQLDSAMDEALGVPDARPTPSCGRRRGKP